MSSFSKKHHFILTFNHPAFQKLDQPVSLIDSQGQDLRGVSLCGTMIPILTCTMGENRNLKNAFSNSADLLWTCWIFQPQQMFFIHHIYFLWLSSNLCFFWCETQQHTTPLQASRNYFKWNCLRRREVWLVESCEKTQSHFKGSQDKKLGNHWRTVTETLQSCRKWAGSHENCALCDRIRFVMILNGVWLLVVLNANTAETKQFTV